MSHYKCKECGSDVYLEALVDADGGVVTIYDSAICADSDCINGSQFSKYWDRIATLEPDIAPQQKEEVPTV